MDPDSIELSNLTKSFEYIKFSNQIDSIDDMNDLKNLAKCYFKLYLKQQEIISEWSVSKP
jgi:putative heme degradation protein